MTDETFAGMLDKLIDGVAAGIGPDVIDDRARVEAYVAGLEAERDRLDWLCLHMRGDELRRLVGELNYTGDVAEFRRAIDAARAERERGTGGEK